MKEWFLRTVDDLRYGQNEGKKRNAMLAVAVGAFVLAGIIAAVNLLGGSGNAGAESRKRDLIDGKTGEVFIGFKVPDNDKAPYLNPKTGERTLYHAEKCFWTKDGKAKLTPTYVLLNELVGKEGPTMCPDCGKRVVGHNPMPPAALLSAAAGEEKK